MSETSSPLPVFSREQALQYSDAAFDDVADSMKLQAQWHLEETLHRARNTETQASDQEINAPEHLEREYTERMAAADNQLAIAMDMEQSLGLDAATSAYQQALEMYIKAFSERPAGASELDHTFYLRIARCQSRMGSSMTLEPYKSPKNIQYPFLPFIDRHDQLIKLAKDNYLRALAGIVNEGASPEIESVVFEQRSEMHALFAEYNARLGKKHIARKLLQTAQKDILAAEILLHQTEELKIVPNLSENIDEQKAQIEQLEEALGFKL